MKKSLTLTVCLCIGLTAFAQVDGSQNTVAGEVREDQGHAVEGNYAPAPGTELPVEIDSAVSPRWEDSLRVRLNALVLDAERGSYNTGICVYDLTDDVMLYGYNQQKLMRPASNEKTLTAVTALDILGADHKYATRLYASGTMVKDESGRGYLDGDIYVVGDFDPSLETADIRWMASEIRKAGIDSISGAVIADISMKDTLMLGNGWCWDDTQPCLTPLSLGGNNYKSKPALINRYKPALQFVSMLRDAIVGDSVKVGGGTMTGTIGTKANVTQIMTVTHTLGDILQRMMKESDNLYAESMFYQLAADKKKGIGWKDCAAEVEAMVRRATGSTDGVKVADGCGLSLYNYVTPAVLTAVLRYAYEGDRIFTALYPALPVAGVDGTIARRMKDSKAYANVHAKTGTVNGVSTLAGYVTARNGHLLAFAIMNNGVVTSAEGHAFQDKVCAVLAE